MVNQEPAKEGRREFTLREIYRLSKNLFSMNRYSTSLTFDYVKRNTNLDQKRIQLIKATLILPIIALIIAVFFFFYDYFQENGIFAIIVFAILIGLVKSPIAFIYTFLLCRFGVIHRTTPAMFDDPSIPEKIRKTFM